MNPIQAVVNAVRRRMRWYRTRVNYTATLDIDGTTIRVPHINGLACELTEPWMLELLEALLPLRAGTFLDVGVNVGQTLIKLRALEPDRPYVGFEPNPACVFYVNQLIEKNGFAACDILPVGLFTEDSILTLEMFSRTKTDTAASLIENYRPDREIVRRIHVPVFRFSTLADTIGSGPVGLVKIDVEGAELEVLQGMLPGIRADRPLILLEVLPAYAADNTTRIGRQQGIERLLAGIDYALFRVGKHGVRFAALQRVDGFGIHSSLDDCDYVAAPLEIADRVGAAAPGNQGTAV